MRSNSGGICAKGAGGWRPGVFCFIMWSTTTEILLCAAQKGTCLCVLENKYSSRQCEEQLLSNE